MAAERAVQIDPNNAHAHETLAKIYWQFRHGDGAMREKALAEIRRAAGLDPKRYASAAKEAVSRGRVLSEFDNEPSTMADDLWAAKSELETARGALGTKTFVALAVSIVATLGWLGWRLCKRV